MEILFKVLRWPLMISVALALVGNGNLWARGPQPHDADTAHVASPYGRIEILRDRDGVPHIRAKSEWESLFGLGYVHAQDRLWQMEFQRRLANGRLAEILGDAGLPTDRLFRTVGLHRTAAATWANFSAQERQPVEAYVAGVNAYLNRQDRQLPPEFGLLGIEPAPWRPEDVLAWTKVVAWGQGSNWDHELLRAQLVPRLGIEKTAQLMPAYTSDGPVILPESSQHSAARRQKPTTGTDEIAAWRWDTVHHAQFPHNPFDANPQLRPVFSRSIPNGGDRFTVNVTSSFRRWDDYDQYHAAAYRQVVDLGNLGNSRFINVPGQSGDPESRHYDDLLKPWQRVEYLPMRYDRKTVDGATRERLEVEP